MKTRFPLTIASALLALGCAPTPPQQTFAPVPTPRAGQAPEAPVPAVAPGGSVYRLAAVGSHRVMVHAADDGALDRAVALGVAHQVKRWPTMDAALLEVDGDDVDGALARLRGVEGVAVAERDGVAVVGWSALDARPARPAPAPAAAAVARLGPNDPRMSAQWALTAIGAIDAWGAALLSTAANGPVVTIAILDTGIDQDHEDLEPRHREDDQVGRIYRDVNFTTMDSVDDRYGHGTHVAGIAAAATNNGLGIAGLDSDARLLNVKVMGDNGIGYDSEIAAGIRWAADHGANIINMSLSQPKSTTALKEAIDYATGKGVLLVAAAGNDGQGEPRYPAAYPEVISVAATSRPSGTKAEARASFSNYGKWVDVAAPGESILSTFPNHANAIDVTDYGYMNGTSMATPMVSGEAALLWRSLGGDPAKVRARIESTSDRSIAGSGTAWANGRIDVDKALRQQ